MRKRNNFRREPSIKEKACGCGGRAKKGSRKNYPHGKKSKPVRFWFFRCKSCGTTTNLIEKGGTI